LRTRDVCLLGRFVTSSEKDDEVIASLRVIHAIAGADIDLEFGDAVSEIALLAWIAVNKTIYTHLDASPGRLILID
jgi:hypothetical protein